MKHPSKATLIIEITFDEKVTDAESISCAFDKLMETALSTPGIMDEYGNPEIGDFFVMYEGENND